MKKSFEVMGIGAVVIDELFVLSHYPTPDEKVEIEKSLIQTGGPVPTALRQLARFNLATSFGGKIGSDERGSIICHSLESSGVDVSLLMEEKGKVSGFASIWIDIKNKTRAIAFSAGDLSPFKETDFNLDDLPNTKILHIDGRDYDSIKTVISHYKSWGTLISIDTGNYRERTCELLKLVDIIIMPRRFAVSCFGDMGPVQLVQSCRKTYPQAEGIFITDGDAGSWGWYQDRNGRQPAFKVQVEDTTGAGDVHAGGILYGILQGWEIEYIMKFAAAAAAIKCKVLGNQDSLPTLDMVNDLISFDRFE